jgi:hypothetical protein
VVKSCQYFISLGLSTMISMLKKDINANQWETL